MAITPPLRPGERSADTEGSADLRAASPVLGAALAAVAAALFLLVTLLVAGVEPGAPAFLRDALGPETKDAPLERSPAPGVDVSIDDDGYTVQRNGSSVSVEAEDASGEEWERYAHGASRPTDFGAETIVVDGTSTESFLTVTERQGPRTWRWKLGTRLLPRIGRDGGVFFFDPTRHREADIGIDPAAILDSDGEDITPEGVSWDLVLDRGEWWLTLELDDSGLPLPYVIDPAADYASPLYLSSQASAVTNSWRLVTGAPAALDTTTDNIPCRNCTGYWQWRPGASNSTSGTPSTTPTGRGWIVDTAGATGFPAGNWSFTVTTDIPDATLVAGTAVLTVGVWKGTLSGGNFSATQTLLPPASGTGATNLRTSVNPVTTTETFVLPKFSLAAGERLYVEYWRNQTEGINTKNSARRRLDFYANDGVARIVHPPADGGGPLHSLSVVEVTNAGGQHFDSATGTHYYNTASGGTFRVDDAATDAGSGVLRVDFPAVSLTGFTHTAASDGASPYQSNTYTWTNANTTSPGAQTIVAEDRALNTSSPSPQLTIMRDVTAPGAFSLTAPNAGAAIRNGQTVSAAPGDSGAGLASVEFRYCPGATCTYAAGTTIGAPDTSAPYSVTWNSQPADGAYTLLARATDNVGNSTDSAQRTITVDNGDPSAVFDFPAAALVYNAAGWNAGCAASGFCGTASDATSGVAGVEISIERQSSGLYWSGGSFSIAGESLLPATLAGSSWSYAFSASSFPADGDYTVHVRATDAAGNVEAGPGRTFTIDTAAPQTTLDSSPADPSASSSAGFDFSASEPGSTFECELDGGGFSPCSSPRSYSSLADGSHTLSVRAADPAGNVDSTPASYTWTVDTAAPQTTIDSNPADPTNATGAGFDFSASDPGVGFECELDGSGFAPCTSPESYPGLADGSHTFRVRATDSAGNTDPTPAAFTWTVDTGAPNTSIDSAPADPSDDDSPSFAFFADEPGASFECELDGGGFAPCTNPQPIGPLAEGSHTFRVRAADGAGNVDATPASRTWTVDTTPPDTSFTVVPADPSNDPAPAFEFTASEPGSSFECELDGGGFAPCASPQPVGPLADGAHTLAVRATDAAGNTDATPASYTWAVNAVAPTVSVTQPSGFVNASDADPLTVRATSPDGDLTGVEFFRCSDSSTDCATGTWISLGTDATAPFEASWPVDADGNRALRAVATDLGSNSGEDVVDVTIDRTLPATTVDSSPPDPNASAAASFAFSASEAAAFECELDGSGFAACAGAASYTGLVDGSHTFRVRAIDLAGNVEAAPQTVTWIVDTVAPQTVLDGAPTDPSGSAAATFEFSAGEAGATFECELDGSGFAACVSPESYAGLADGRHTFRVRATDAAGNVDPTPASHTWTVDATPPGGGLTDPGANLRGTVALAAAPSDAGAGVRDVEFQLSPADADTWTPIALDGTAAYTADWDTTGAADGLYDLRVVVTDNAGNATRSAVVEDRRVDNTAPTATMDDPGAYLRAIVDLTATVSDSGSGVASVSFERSPAGVGAWTATAASWDTAAGADGLYDLRAIVVDAAGNSTVSAAVTSRRVDNTAPGISSSAPADGTTLGSAASLQLVATEDVAGLANATLDGAPAVGAVVSGSTLTWFGPFDEGPHTLAGELEDLAGNRRPIRVHFTVWSLAGAAPYVEKNSYGSVAVSLRAASDAATVTMPAGAWTGAPADDWLVLRVDPQPAGAVPAGFGPAGDVLDVTAYRALNGTHVHEFARPVEIAFDNSVQHVVPATFEEGSWRSIPAVPSPGTLPSGWADGFYRDGTNVVVLTRHLSSFSLLEDVQAPSVPTGFRGTVSRGKLTLAWEGSTDNAGIGGYRVYADGSVVRTAAADARSAGIGRFRLSDRRSFRVAAEDVTGNLSAKSFPLKVVPKVTRLSLAGAKKAVVGRGFKLGKVRYERSESVARGIVLRGSASGLRKAGSRVGLTVSSGSGTSAASDADTTAPPPASSPGAVPPPPFFGAPAAAPLAPPAAPPTPVPTAEAGNPSAHASGRPEIRPEPLAVQAPSAVRKPVGYVLLVLAVGAAALAGLRLLLRSRRVQTVPGGIEPLLLWDARLVHLAARALLRLTGRR